jgi:hypothetical protein
MKGITSVVLEGDELVVKFNVKGDFGPSSTGKTRIVASTAGTYKVPDLGIGFNLTAWKKQ